MIFSGLELYPGWNRTAPQNNCCWTNWIMAHKMKGNLSKCGKSVWNKPSDALPLTFQNGTKRWQTETRSIRPCDRASSEAQLTAPAEKCSKKHHRITLSDLTGIGLDLSNDSFHNFAYIKLSVLTSMWITISEMVGSIDIPVAPKKFPSAHSHPKFLTEDSSLACCCDSKVYSRVCENNVPSFDVVQASVGKNFFFFTNNLNKNFNL